MKLYISLAAYVGAIVAANYLTANHGLVSVGFGMLVTAGTFAAGFALLARDFVQRHGGIGWAFGAVGIGAVLSWFLATPALALASTVAFVGAGVVDLLIFTPSRRRLGFVPAALFSNVVSAPIDTALFLWIAGFPLTMGAIQGQFVGKVIWATVIPLTIYLVGRRAILRQSVRV